MTKQDKLIIKLNKADNGKQLNGTVGILIFQNFLVDLGFNSIFWVVMLASLVSSWLAYVVSINKMNDYKIRVVGNS